METNNFFRNYRNLMARLALSIEFGEILNIPENMEIKKLIRYEDRDKNNFLYLQDQHDKIYIVDFYEKMIHRSIPPKGLFNE